MYCTHQLKPYLTHVGINEAGISREIFTDSVALFNHNLSSVDGIYFLGRVSVTADTVVNCTCCFCLENSCIQPSRQ